MKGNFNFVSRVRLFNNNGIIYSNASYGGE